jgi:hypothetical protein
MKKENAVLILVVFAVLMLSPGVKPLGGAEVTSDKEKMAQEAEMLIEKGQMMKTEGEMRVEEGNVQAKEGDMLIEKGKAMKEGRMADKAIQIKEGDSLIDKGKLLMNRGQMLTEREARA